MMKQQSTTSKALFGLSILIFVFGIIQLSLSLSVAHKIPAEKAKAQIEVTYPWPYDGSNSTSPYNPRNYYPYSFLTSVSDAITAIAALALASGALGLLFTFKPEFGWVCGTRMPEREREEADRYRHSSRLVSGRSCIQLFNLLQR
ncbi:hypothetical protein CB0940_03814 [Cercospora beticola]|uniref:Uncharacterized protein n=1 Tax=Cercospora beticola TaxID=122368 RepID=A0A2G5I3S4_CERBT|nr:hypothetical protein CB0940_03814 [Cercospora beticola]PIA99142.1 hypothetical protein CB0940_03814 [Cercospora beticola]